MMVQINIPGFQSQIKIIEFSSEEVLSSGFSLRVKILLNTPGLSLKTFLAKSKGIQIELSHCGHVRYFHGCLTEVHFEGEYQLGVYQYSLKAKAWFELAKSEIRNRVFENLSIDEIISTLCQHIPFYSVQFKLLKPIPAAKYLVQYNESSYDFLRGLFTDLGLFYYFVSDSSSHTMIVTDSVRLLKQVEIDFKSDHQFYKRDLLDLTDHYCTDKKILNFSINPSVSQSRIFHRSISYLCLAAPGCSFDRRLNHLEENTIGVVEKVFHQVDTLGLYQNSIEWQEIKPNMTYQSNKVKRSKSGGLHVGEVVSEQDQLNFSCPVRYNWLNSAHKSTYLIPSVQLAQGCAWDMCFRPQVGDEVRLVHIEGNMNQPIIAGYVYNDRNKPIYPSSDQKHTSGIVTKLKGHSITFGDQKQNEKMNTYSSGDLNINVARSFTEKVQENMKVQVGQTETLDVKQGAACYRLKALYLKTPGAQLIMEEQVTILADKVILKSLSAPNGVSAVVVGNEHVCPLKENDVDHVGGMVLSGSQSVSINGKGLACVGDRLFCHVREDKIVEGVSDITVNGRAVAYVGAKSEHGGTITNGQSLVVF